MAGDTELIRFQEDKDGFVLTLDTHLYRPSELFLTVKEGKVNISGTSQSKVSLFFFQYITSFQIAIDVKTILMGLIFIQTKFCVWGVEGTKFCIK